MKNRILAGAGFAVAMSGIMSGTAHAQAAPSSGGESLALEEVIVTARRKSESLQDVPQTVDVVTSESIGKLSLQKFEDVQAIVPGLTLTSGATGYTTAATIRGASYQVESGASPTVEFYLNEAPIQSVFLFQQMYDVGQIEVLRGPQGTLRGRAAPSGSITVTSQQPNLSEFGGYANTVDTDRNAYMTQAALNIPIISDTLALRVAGIYDNNEYDHVKSINNGSDPSQKTQSGRATLRWAVGDAITANIMYQVLKRDLFSWDEVQSFSLAEPTAPVVQPIIQPGDRLSVMDGGRQSTQRMKFLTALVEGRFAGHKLSYVGTYSKMHLLAPAPSDIGNAVPNFEFYQQQTTDVQDRAHELRLASEERLFGMLDYTVGGFYQNFSSPSDLLSPTLIAVQTGPYTLFPATLINTPVARRSGTEETSFFANGTVHFGERTEVSAGARHITFKANSSLGVGGAILSDVNSKETPTVWNISGSHGFTESFMVYANIGTSWRDGPTAVGIFRPLTPRLQQFLDLKSEDSKSYEAGFKASFLDNRLRFNASVFHQDFKNFIYRGSPVWYVNLGRTGAAPAQFALLSNVDASINGAELDFQAQATENFNVGLTFAYSKGKMKNGVIPCNDFDGDGVPDLHPPVSPTVGQILAAAGTNNPLTEAVAACTVNDRLAFAPDWSSTLQAEYKYPVTDAMGVFGRGLFSYNGANVRDPHNSYDDVSGYGLLNLYAGLRGNTGGWEVSLFLRNVLDTEKVLNRSNGPTATPYTTTTGVGSSLATPYMTASVTPGREFGVNLRFAFGSR